MKSVEEALATILEAAKTLPAERVELLRARGRVLAEDVHADIDNPPFTNSSMDGYAVIASDVAHASSECPVLLDELAETSAGSVPHVAVKPGTCARVMTGAPIPKGADAVVMIEDAIRRTQRQVEIRRAAKVGEYIRYAGEDVKAGSKVISSGVRLGMSEIAMLATMGCGRPLCIRQPRVAVLTSGDELVNIEEQPGPGKLRDCNLHALTAGVEEAGGIVHSMLRLPDDLDATKDALRNLTGLDGRIPPDVIVASGGVSVGDRDYIKPALEDAGSLDLWRVRMKPGKPLAVGRIADTLFIGLPGNPVSTLVTFELFVRPVLLQMVGRTDIARPRLDVLLETDMEHAPGRREYVRASVRRYGSQYLARPTGEQGSGFLSSMIGANALLIIDEETIRLKRGEVVEAILLKGGVS